MPFVSYDNRAAEVTAGLSEKSKKISGENIRLDRTTDDNSSLDYVG